MATTVTYIIWYRMDIRDLVVYAMAGFVDLIFIIAMFGIATFAASVVLTDVQFYGITKKRIVWNILGTAVTVICVILAIMDIAAMTGQSYVPAIFRW